MCRPGAAHVPRQYGREAAAAALKSHLYETAMRMRGSRANEALGEGPAASRFYKAWTRKHRRRVNWQRIKEVLSERR